MLQMQVLDTRYAGRRAALLKDWQNEMRRCESVPEFDLMA